MEDYISRQAAIDEIARWIGYIDEDMILRIQTGLKKVPPAQPERKTGKWIERNPQNSPNCRLIECSECGNAYIVGYNIDYDYWIDRRNFCTKCGADMRGEQDG